MGSNGAQSAISLEEALAERVACLTRHSVDPGLLHILKRNILDSHAGIHGHLKDKGILANFDRLPTAFPSGAEPAAWDVSKQRPCLILCIDVILPRRGGLLNPYFFSPTTWTVSIPRKIWF